MSGQAGHHAGLAHVNWQIPWLRVPHKQLPHVGATDDYRAKSRFAQWPESGPRQDWRQAADRRAIDALTRRNGDAAVIAGVPGASRMTPIASHGTGFHGRRDTWKAVSPSSAVRRRGAEVDAIAISRASLKKVSPVASTRRNGRPFAFCESGPTEIAASHRRSVRQVAGRPPARPARRRHRRARHRSMH